MQHTPRLLFELEELRSLHGMIIEEEKAMTIYIPIEFDRSIVVKQQLLDIEPLITIKIDYLFPFSIPDVKYFDKDIQKIYKVHLVNELKELNESSKQCLICNKKHCIGCVCMCCSTIICRNNWNPQYKLVQIVEECKKFINIKCRLIERLHCKKIQHKFLKEIPIKYLPIHNYL